MKKEKIKEAILKKINQKIKENIKQENYEECNKLKKLILKVDEIDYDESMKLANETIYLIKKHKLYYEETINELKMDDEEFILEVISLEIYSQLTGEDFEYVLKELEKFNWLK